MNSRHSLSETLRLSLGLENNNDNSQVSINFDIKTEEVDGSDDKGVELAEEATNDLQDSVDKQDNEAGKMDTTNDEIEELDEAQRSLESIALIIDNARNGLSPQEAAFCRIAIESIVGKDNFRDLNIPSMESFNNSRHNATLELKSKVALIQQAIQRTSLESNVDLIEDYSKHQGDATEVINLIKEKALKLKDLATDAKHEHGSQKTVTVNGKGLGLHHLAVKPFTEEETLLKALAKLKGFLDGVNPQIDNADNITDKVYPTTNEYRAAEDGVKFELFSLTVTKTNEGVIHVEDKMTEEKAEFPVLTPSTIDKACDHVIEIADKLSELSNGVAGATNAANDSDKMADGDVKSLSNVVKATADVSTAVIHILSDIIKYGFFSASNREFEE